MFWGRTRNTYTQHPCSTSRPRLAASATAFLCSAFLFSPTRAAYARIAFSMDATWRLERERESEGGRERGLSHSWIDGELQGKRLILSPSSSTSQSQRPFSRLALCSVSLLHKHTNSLLAIIILLPVWPQFGWFAKAFPRHAGIRAPGPASSRCSRGKRRDQLRFSNGRW